MVESAEQLQPTRVGQVMRVIQSRIDRRQYTPGSRIPSVRAMAESMGVSKSTVVEAYGRLAAEGVVQPRLGSGFYVAAPLAPLDLAELGTDTDPTVDPLWMMRQALRPGENNARPGCGWLPDSWMPHETMRKALRAAASLSAAVAHRLLKISAPHGLVIIEDDIFGDFEEQPAPRLAAFDGLDRVVRVSSFSKTLSASVRSGYIACRADWIRGLTDLRMVTGMATSPLNAELLSAMLVDGSYRRHVERVRDRLARQRQAVKTKLARLGIVPWIEPAG